MRNATWMRNFTLRCLFGMVTMLGASVLQGGPYDSWGYHAPVTFSGYDRAETLTNFPVLVALSPACFGGATPFSYKQFRSGTNDLAFTDADGKSLNYEIETWDPSGASTVWVQVPTLTNNTVITAWWGAPGQAAPACTTNGSVWSNSYAGVWHLSGDNNDSTWNRNNLTTNGAVTTNAGIVGYDRGMVSNSVGYIQATNSASLTNFTVITMEAWVKTTDTRPGDTGGGRIVDKDFRNYAMHIYNGAPCLSLNGVDGASWQIYKGAVSAADGQWHHVAGTWDGTTVRVYTDGRGNQYSKSGSINRGTTPLRIGCRADGTGRQFDGQIDEVRISSLARSSNWLWAAYQNTASNAVFQSYGTVVASSSGTVIYIQ